MAITKVDGPTVESPEPAHEWTELTEEEASQGFKTGHMRWVLAIGLFLATVTVAVVAFLH